MTILGIDSSDDVISVGIVTGSKIVISKSSDGKKKNIVHSFMMETLEEAGISLSDIEGVAVSIGPGSFTGLRVGLAAAKGICWSRRLPLAGVPSLKALAACVKTDCDRFIAVKDAKRGEFYYGGFSMIKGALSQTTPDSIGSAGAVMSTIEDIKAVGPGVAVLRKHQIDLEKITEISYNPALLGGEVARLGDIMISSGQTLEPSDSAPVYIRMPAFVKQGA